MNSYEWLRYLHDLNDYISCIWIWEQIMTLELVAIRMSILILSSLAPSTKFYSTDLLPHSHSSLTHLISSRLEGDFIMQHFLEATITMSHGTQLHPTQLYCQNSKRSTHLKWFKLKIHNFHNFHHFHNHTRPDKERIRCHGSQKSQQKLNPTS